MKPFWALGGKPLNKFTTVIYFKDYEKDKAVLRGL